MFRSALERASTQCCENLSDQRKLNFRNFVYIIATKPTASALHREAVKRGDSRANATLGAFTPPPGEGGGAGEGGDCRHRSARGS